MFDINPDYYHIGIEQIDKEHDRLFELTNQVYALLQNNALQDKSSDILHIISELIDYARIHFAHEEAYMSQIKYANREAHIVQHRRFELRLAQIDFDALEASPIDSQTNVLMNLLDFLSDWLINHIISEDMRFTEE